MSQHFIVTQKIRDMLQRIVLKFYAFESTQLLQGRRQIFELIVVETEYL